MVFLGDAKGNESFLTKFYVIPITMKLENPWCVMLLRRAEHAVAPTSSSQECTGSWFLLRCLGNWVRLHLWF